MSCMKSIRYEYTGPEGTGFLMSRHAGREKGLAASPVTVWRQTRRRISTVADDGESQLEMELQMNEAVD